MPTPFKELSGSPHETFGPQGMTAVRQLICAWADRRNLVQELLGDGYELGGSSPVNYPGSPSIVAVRVEVEPLGDDLVRQDFASLTEGLNAYEGFAKITAHYELLSPLEGVNVPQAAAPNTFLMYKMDIGVETVRLGGNDLSWPGNPDAVFPADAQGDVVLPVTIHRLTWRRVVNPPWTAVRECQGTLNETEFLGVPAGQLLFDGVSADREFLSLPDLDNPQFGWQLAYRFRERPLMGKVPTTVFRTGDFERLLRVEEGG